MLDPKIDTNVLISGSFHIFDRNTYLEVDPKMVESNN